MKVLQIFESDEFKKFRAKRELRVHKGKLVMTNKNMMVMTMVVMRVDAGSGHHDHRGQPQGDRHGHLRLRHPGTECCLPCESSFQMSLSYIEYSVVGFEFINQNNIMSV